MIEGDFIARTDRSTDNHREGPAFAA